MNLQERLHQIFSVRWIQHFSFWTVFLLLESGRFANLDAKLIPKELLLEGISLFFIIFLVYLNLRVLIPKYWNTGNYSKYILSIIFVEVATISTLSFILYKYPEAGFKRFTDLGLWKIMMMNTFKTNIFVLSSSLFHFVKEWIALKDENLKYTANAQEQLAAELSVLKAQVNPHFLFNTLNNIYSMSLYDSVKTPEMILKLSQLLSYMLYECKDERVRLEKEIHFIKNYIELEAVRVEDVAKINLQIKGEDPGHKIPPLLFIPLIENAFKHGISEKQETSEIRISMKIAEHSIEMEINNPLDPVSEKYMNSKHNGLGIENVKKRLQLLFPKQHTFRITQTENQYTTQLSLSV
ncbi:sensor histidine kinase [Labilibaculum sp.]|uniref:sensor histidine kinase n=1 Tax=Labilibaculum sp. TaxID=2060723 RepID=UPI00356206CD